MVGGHRTPAPLQTMPEPGGMPGRACCLIFGDWGEGGHIGVNRSSSVAEEGLMNFGHAEI